ncbi:hypothetical protein BC332_09066 [Capsicum chinense]|nr:hypothetical protein BC332_09066 [Capsicum chinense]
MYSRPKVLITYCRKRRNSISLPTSIPDMVEDVAIQENKTKSTNVNATLPDECTVFASKTRSRQMYPRPRVLITYCRKRKRNSVSLASIIPAIVEDDLIQESKAKSANVDITLSSESSEFIEVNDFSIITRSQQVHPRPRILITYFRKRRRNSSILGNSLPAFVEKVGSSAVIPENRTQVTNSGPLSLSCCSGILEEEVITREEMVSVGAQQILVKAAGESSSVKHWNEKKILAVDNSTENSNNSACDTIKNVADIAEFPADGYANACAFGSSTNEIFDGERESLAESNSSCSRLCAFIDEKNEITDVVTVPPLRRALNGRSNKKLLVLDLNGLLADIVPLQHVPYGFKVDAIVSGKAVFKRPFHDDFLQFCFEKFNVGVWSSRIRKNVELVLDFLLGNAKEKLLFCWGRAGCHKGDWWWNEEVKKKVEIKKEAYVKLIESEDEAEKRVNREVYKVAREEAKLVVTAAKSAVFESFLLNEEGDKGIKLGELEHSEESRDFSYCRCFKVEEVTVAIFRMWRGRTTGPDEISVDFWKYAGGTGLRRLMDLFNGIFKTARMPEAWR